MPDISVHMLPSRLTSALRVDPGCVVVTDATVVVPPRVLALDGVDLDASLVVCRADDVASGRVDGVPWLVVDLSAAGAFARTRRTVWRELGVRERWSPAASGGLAIETVGGSFELAPEARLRRSGPGWSCDVTVADLLAT